MQVFKALRNKKQKTEILRKLKIRELIEVEKDFLRNSSTAKIKQTIHTDFQTGGLKKALTIKASMTGKCYQC